MNRKQLIPIRDQIQSTMKESEVIELAFKTGFTERIHKVDPFELMMSLLSSFAAGTVDTISAVLSDFNSTNDKSVQYKPFHNQLSKQTFPVFIREVVNLMLARLVSQTLEAVPGSALARFTDILIQDGTSFAVHDELAARFPGRFTKVSPAAVELHTTMSLLTGQATRIQLTEDKRGEREFLPKPEEATNCLTLADRGYDGAKYCSELHEAGGSYIIRWRSAISATVVAAYLSPGVPPIVANQPFSAIREALKGHDADLDIALSKKTRCKAAKGKLFRLVMIWNPELKSHMLLMTNLPREDFPPTTVRAVYSLRWQVELLFKEWKSHANLHALGTRKEGIVEGFIWIALVAAALKRYLANAAQQLAGVPISTLKAARALTNHVRELIGYLADGIVPLAFVDRMLRFLRDNVRRAHPKREAARGRLSTGLLRPVLGMTG